MVKQPKQLSKSDSRDGPQRSHPKHLVWNWRFSRSRRRRRRRRKSSVNFNCSKSTLEQLFLLLAENQLEALSLLACLLLGFRLFSAPPVADRNSSASWNAGARFGANIGSRKIQFERPPIALAPARRRRKKTANGDKQPAASKATS